ncbi:hypothetical protein [Herbaspirillum rubrisubalbicans]|uniref:Uncharacterized protein n=1 Tax=Herbaspirillum rubrisubalbicans TaxID=80842 RepID=A0AAD0UAB5_9BURK|nr:hypothetical protein [Herbaspirillum rubrisubalbicans]ALU90689.1 Hypothetical protein Hrubri_3532 [Herbaspirillum rubrisubalbicans M1]AYR25728.1 hypothetical protein RC54_18755 [Herbaspirillum rubrisubalbicans]
MNTSRSFTFSANWPDPTDDVAEFRLQLGHTVISRIADIGKGTNRDYFRASATTLAFWLADNWWRLRWETLSGNGLPSIDWRLRHELNSAAGGELWPRVMIYSVGDRIAFAPSVGKKTVGGPQAYFDFPVGVVPADDYERELDALLAAILGHCAKMADGEALQTLVAQIARERNDPELAGWRRLEACLGFDADMAPDAVINALVDLEAIAGENGVEEAARAVPGANCPQTLHTVIEATKASTLEIDLGMAAEISEFLSDQALPSAVSPWRMAEVAADHLREIIGIVRGPLNNDELTALLKIRWDDIKAATATARKLPYTARIDGQGKSRVALQNKVPVSLRFELMRQLGDAVWAQEEHFGIVSRSKSDRQRFQRAFANSLLCPFDDIQRELDVANPTPEDMEEVARRYAVHPSVVRYQLVYKGYLPFENASEAVEAV